MAPSNSLESLDSAVVIDLNAAIVAVTCEQPRILLRFSDRNKESDKTPIGLPYGLFDPAGHRTLEEGLRAWVKEQTGLHLGYVEQLYTFGDRFRDPKERKGGPRPVSVGYVALVHQTNLTNPKDAAWSGWYRFFPWEDWRAGQPPMLDSVIIPKLEEWCNTATTKAELNRMRDRADLAFGLRGAAWDGERVLERYELLYEVGLVAESLLDTRVRVAKKHKKVSSILGQPLIQDHRRILATAMGRLRGKIKYRPVIFELMQRTFTLLQLQRTVEALSGTRLHKQNFRRLVENEGLVEPTGGMSTRTGGRPAALFCFRPEVLHERPAPGVRLVGRPKSN